MYCKWKVVYRDGYGGEMVLACFRFLMDAEKYVACFHKFDKERVRIEEG